MTQPCKYCQTPFEANNRGGPAKEFCRPRCRALFHNACRRYGEALVDKGLLSPGALREWHESAVHGEEAANG